MITRKEDYMHVRHYVAIYGQQIGPFDNVWYQFTLVYQFIPLHLSFFVTNENPYCSQHTCMCPVQ